MALNLASLGVRTELAGFLGADSEADTVRSACEAQGIGSEALVPLPGGHTISKTRVIAEMHQMLRIDEEVTDPKTDAESDQLLTAVKKRLSRAGVSAVVLSDYAKGCCTTYFCAELIRACRQAAIPVYVDPKGRDYAKYRGATAIKPNRLELTHISETMGWPLDDEISAARSLREFLDAEFVALTLGARGIALVQQDSVDRMPTVAQEVFDVSGAGDTVMATLVASLASGLPLLDAVGLANLAAADVVARAGTTAITTEALLVAIQAHHHSVGLRKLYDLGDLKAVISAWRSKGQRVAFTNGCYDLVHAGHITLLGQASGYADRLVVGINSDASVSRLKGPSRPIMPQEKRAVVLSALESIDAVVIFEEDTPFELIQQIRPDVLIKGADYDKANVVGADFVESYGGEVRLIPLVPGVSTSYLVAAMEKL